MTARQQLNTYIERLQRRLRLRTFLRGASILALLALVTTVVLVLITNALAFSSASLTSARIILFLVLAVCIVFACTLPLLRLNRRRSAWEAEAVVPDFEQRLITLAERDPDDREPYTELLAADTLTIARGADAAHVVSNKRLLMPVGTALASLGVLVWMIVAGPGYLGYGAALLWTGDAGATPLYDLRVSPGDATVRGGGRVVTPATRGSARTFPQPGDELGMSKDLGDSAHDSVRQLRSFQTLQPFRVIALTHEIFNRLFQQRAIFSPRFNGGETLIFQ